MNEVMRRSLDLFELDLRVDAKSVATIEHYTRAVTYFERWHRETLGVGLEPKLIKPEPVKRWIVDLRESSSPSTVRNYFVGLRVYARWLMKEGVLKVDPTKGISLPEIPETIKPVLDSKAVLRVLTYLEKRKNWRDAALISLLFDTGMRSKEVCSLECEDIDFETETITIRHRGGRLVKNHSERVVGFSATTHRYMARYKSPELATGTYFLTRLSTPFNRFSLWDAVKSRCQDAGESGVHTHLLRHSAASALALAGMDRADMDTIFGWDDPRTSKVYTRSVARQRALASQKKLHPFSNR